MFNELKRKDLERQGYRFVGRHSAIKVCEWAKKSILCEDACYKSTFYGIQSWRCIQMTPSFACQHRCLHCWRDIDFAPTKLAGKPDSPKEIVEGCIKAHVQYLQGYKGNAKADKNRLAEAPLHFAISLAGEPTSYPKLPELIDEIKRRKMTAFLVSNGTNPKMIKKLISHQPTQLYITLPAPDEKTYLKVCNPSLRNGWSRILESLKLLKHFKRSAIRLTLARGLNMSQPGKYAEILKATDFDFAEFKAYMWVGYSQLRLGIENMPTHEEIRQFAEEVCKPAKLKIIGEKPRSRVVLAAKSAKTRPLISFP